MTLWLDRSFSYLYLHSEQTIRIVNDMFQSDWDRQGDVVHIDRTEMHMKEVSKYYLCSFMKAFLD